MAEVSDNLTLSDIAALNELDDQIEALQGAKRNLISERRDEYGKRYANALKSAVKLSRMDSGKRTELEATDAETFRILALIERSPAPRATRTREIIEEFDPETGEIGLAEPAWTHDDAPANTKSAQPIQPETANEARGELVAPPRIVADHDMDEGGEAAASPSAGGQNAVGASESGAPISMVMKPDKSGAEQSASAPVRHQWQHSDPPHPDCLNPTGCGGFSNLGLCERCKAAKQAAA